MINQIRSLYYLHLASQADRDTDCSLKVLDYLDRAIKFNSRNFAALAMRAFVKGRSQIKDLSGALADINRAIELNSECWFYYEYRANLKYYEFKQTDEAIEDLKIAINKCLPKPFIKSRKHIMANGHPISLSEALPFFSSESERKVFIQMLKTLANWSIKITIYAE